MSWQLRLPKKWQNFIDKLEKIDQEKINQVLDEIKINPYENDGIVQKFSPTKVFKRRAGDYRILYLITKKIKIIDIVKIGHRKNVYN
ncbi:type II toxin-antitoxin system RelE/ParE family toxin [Promethearchaeum syntrophicum]|uniref:Type II toxin-antitoxin system RelE/ParE family toxin n=1 Tax=Promethearchaeum syntrophicum TaxID=2594042 RepID=A0AC61ZTY8_9ARCH